jgi:aminoglycoside N3'-acetyltransferase
MRALDLALLNLLMVVTRRDIRSALRALGLSGRPVCLHSSLRSFGHVDEGATGVVTSLLDEGCTILVPTFSSAFEVTPPPDLQFERNGWSYDDDREPCPVSDRIYDPEVSDIDREMGAIPAAVVAWPGRVRGNHPLDSFTAVGPRAAELVLGQAPLDVYAPLTALARMGGFLLLMGVGLERTTLLHQAEKEAGRNLFRRWANGADGQPIVVEVGGCSEGFGNLEPYLRSVMRTTIVGQSTWKLYAAAQVLDYATAAIRAGPQITHCSVARCERCDDAVAGGPILL